jgi:signal peptidase I
MLHENLDENTHVEQPVEAPLPPRKKKNNGLWETVRFAVLAFVIVWPIRAFVAQPFIVSGSSMVPTFENSQYLIVDQISYRLEDPKRGDVVIFKYPNDTSKYFIKRIIGLPGETVIINGSNVSVKDKDGNITPLDEPYVKNISSNKMETDLGDGEYFVMGDNRDASSDSRVWGNLDRHFIVGRALIRLLPAGEFGFNPGDYKYSESQE